MQVSINYIHNRKGLNYLCGVLSGRQISKHRQWLLLWDGAELVTGPGVKKCCIEGFYTSLCMAVEDHVFSVNVFNFSDNRLFCVVQGTESNSHLSFQ